MRIVHVSDCYAPRVGGIETQVRDLARNQVKAGHEVHVITATSAEENTSTRAGVELDDGVQVHRISFPNQFNLPVNPNAPSLLRGLLHKINPDVVHIQAGMVSLVAFEGVREANALRFPILITWHCMLNGIRSSLRAGIALTGWDREPIALSAVSVAVAEQVATAFGGYCDVGVTPNGIDLERWKPSGDAITEKPRARRPLQVVATMRLAPRKRSLPLLRILQEAAKLSAGQDQSLQSFQPIQATVLGSGPMEKTARRYLDRHGLDWIDLRGRVPREELQHIYSTAEVFVAPAKLESFGIAALEARTSGLAVVAYKGTGVQEFVRDGVEGLIVDSDRAMAQAIARLAAEPDLLEQIRRHNVNSSPTHSWSSVVRTVELEYRRAQDLRRDSEPIP